MNAVQMRAVMSDGAARFVLPYFPFVGNKLPFIFTFVGRNQPFVGLQDNSSAFRSQPKTHGGFTLIELIITLAVAALLFGLAIPPMSSFIKNNRLSTQTNQMVAHINMARGEAIKRGRVVILCRSNNPTAAAPVCQGDPGPDVANNWSKGWLIYATTATSGQRAYQAGDSLLAVGAGIPSGVTITSNSDGNIYLAFNPNGSLVSGNTQRYAICDDRNEAGGRVIELSPTGRPNILHTTASGTATDCSPT
jgi:type IV fimbrial biogenesis protein FimT